MLLRQDPSLKRKPRRVRSQGEEVLILGHNAKPRLRLLPDNVAEHATLLIYVVLLGPFQLLDHVDRKNGQCDQLRMRVLQRSPGRLPVILENQDVLKAPVLLQIKNAVAEGPKHTFDSFGRQCCQAGIMIGSFNDDLVRPDPIHPVEQALGLAVQVALNAECRELVGNHPHRPSRRIALRWRPPIRVRAVRLNLRRRLAFVPIAERAKAPFQFHSVTGEVRWTLGAVSRNNYPPAYNWIFSKLRQRLNPFNKGLSRFKAKPLFYATGKAFRNSSISGRLD